MNQWEEKLCLGRVTEIYNVMSRGLSEGMDQMYCVKCHQPPLHAPHAPQLYSYPVSQD